MNVTADSRINTEPAVVHTSLRDLDVADPTTGDQILVSTSSANGPGATGGIGYVVHNTASGTTTAARTLLPAPRLQNVEGIAASTVSSIAVDPGGAVFFYDGSSDAPMRMDVEGRVSKVVGAEQHASFQVANSARSTNVNFLDPPGATRSP